MRRVEEQLRNFRQLQRWLRWTSGSTRLWPPHQEVWDMEVKHHIILLICLRCLTNFSCFLFFDGSDLRPYPGIQIWDPGPQMSKIWNRSQIWDPGPQMSETGPKFQISNFQKIPEVWPALGQSWIDIRPDRPKWWHTKIRNIFEIMSMASNPLYNI